MIISQNPLAKKYATAYLNVHEDALTDPDIKAISAAYTFLKTHHTFIHLLCVISFDKKEMIRVCERLIHDFALPETMSFLMVLLVKHKHICYLKEILQDIYCLYKVRKNIVKLEIKTADHIDAQAVYAFEQFFAHESGKKIESIVSIDRSLIAGVRLQSEFFLWEYSVASQLRAFKTKMCSHENGY